LREEVQSKNLLAAAGYMNRYQPSVRRAKEAMSGDDAILAYGWWLGGPPTVTVGKPAPFISQWWPDRDKSGGQFHEQVTHTVDLVRHFLGDAQEVFAHGTTAFNTKVPNLAPSYNMDDAMTTSIKFKSGALASILASVSTPAGGGILLDVHGAKTSVKFSGWGHDATILRKD
jgi:predicted dehydrogenase